MLLLRCLWWSWTRHWFSKIFVYEIPENFVDITLTKQIQWKTMTSSMSWNNYNFIQKVFCKNVVLINLQIRVKHLRLIFFSKAVGCKHPSLFKKGSIVSGLMLIFWNFSKQLLCRIKRSTVNGNFSIFSSRSSIHNKYILIIR